MSKSRTVGKAAAVFAAAVVCALLCRAVFPKPATLHNLDFIEYWTAFHIAGRGGNPYDPAAMLAMQRELGRAGTQPLMMWNPPFIFVLLYPILQLPYAASAAVFFWVNVLLLIAAAVIFRSLYFPAGSPLSLPLLVTFLFYP
ncbi:MAG TPA: hypothetical protein PLP17_11940, partial [Oligoflexia bacterium]|nr:hypothetical protein [Oligoflexia bacterium]